MGDTCWRWALIVRDILTTFGAVGLFIGIVAGSIWLDKRAAARRKAWRQRDPEGYAAAEARRERHHNFVGATLLAIVGLSLLLLLGVFLFHRWYGC